MTVGYESWGEINADHTNCILLCTGLSSHSHAASSERNTNPGWWEKFIGPGKALDTNKFFVVCTNVLGSCYGTTGPSSINPETGKHYATDFPAITVADMVKLQMRFLSEKFSIFSLHAAVGSSLGGMQSLAVAAEFGPERVGRVVSISACAQSHPTSIAIRYAQRRCIVTDPNWQHGHFYDTESYPSVGMKTARIMGTISYRSGPEWLKRFKNNRIDEDKHMGEPHGSGFGPDFMIEAYLSHQSESFATRYDPNSILYISKAMDMFDLGRGFGSLSEGLQRIKVPTLVLGVQSDILFPVFQQKQIAQLLREGGNKKVTYYELDAIYGHDTFLLDVKNVGGAVKGHIEHNLSSAAEQYKASGC
ncbi:homoserine O-acetyltransferase [Sphaeroforma arctica JP610]|uniref:Homoserine O-acetyltransferase n=1 Tax=Sphaeroforma arctica JP610 TaxID=667725 RepID=A0A0L0G884_9EUKA|nr:homoserine O-acetyltransferase [Sphaeroforma arctica JP610]KNC85081.1 homoserine O-acetyltransferase [Sphaeroforma arctica JP610]|eukprot:XP_014158983.1 homoserine O-acetyltransferase [Sphaeroforma arctica JP610]